MKFKKVAAVLVAVSSLFGNCAVWAEETASEATAVLGENAVCSGMTAKSGSDNLYPHTTVEKDGRSGWYIEPARNDQPAVYVNLDKNFAYNLSDFSSYEVSVDYYDEGSGQFRILYDGTPDPWKDASDNSKTKKTKSEIVKLEDTKKWKTHTFLLETPRFKDGYNGADFAVTLHEEAMGISLAGVTFGKITVKKAETKSPVLVKMSTDAIGNNFFSGENVKIKLEAYNRSKEDQKVTVKLHSVDFEKNDGYSDSFDMEIGGSSKSEKEIEFVPEKYQLYTMYAEVSGEGSYSTQKIEYSYSIQNEKKNSMLSVNNHMYRIMNRNPDKLIPLMDKLGVGWNREGIWWNFYEPKKGEYRMPERAEYTNKMFHDYGIDQMLILSGSSPWYGMPNKLPDGEVAETGFLNYIRAQVTELKGQIHCYELMNETNAHKSADWYARLTRGAYKIVKEIDPSITFVIGGTSGTPLEWLREVMTKAEGCFDAVSIHPYGMQTSPEESKRYEAILSVRELMNSCGAADKPINISEMGWSTGWVSYEKQAAFNSQIYAIATSPELGCDNIMYYDFHDDGYMPEDQENNFGFIRTWDTVDTPYLAKPCYIAMCNLNHFLNGAKQTERKIEDMRSFYRFKAADGRDILMFWSRNENDYITVSIGDNNAEVYDMYGNKMNVWRQDGKYSLCVDCKPVYIVGNFSGFELSEPVFDISDTVLTMPYDDTAEITITKSIPDNAKVEFVLPENSASEVVENNGFSANKAVIKLHAKGEDGRADSAELKITSDDGTVFVNEKILLQYTKMLDIDFRVEPYGDGNLARWVGVVNIKNKNHVYPVKGKIVFNSPSDFKEKIKTTPVPEIAADSEKEFRFNMPEARFASAYYIDMDVVLDSGYTQNFRLYSDCLAATYAKTKPTIDGVISENEWDDKMHLKIGNGNQYELIPGSYKGNDDLSADVVFEWDEENLYMLAKVTDDVMNQPYTSAGIWGGDCIQMGLSYNGAADPDETLFTEVGFALTSEGTQIQRWSNEKGATGETKDAKAVVVRQGDQTIYELSMPWRELIKDGAEIKANSVVRFNMIVNDNDGAGRWGWIEYAQGIGVEKDGSLFGRMNLIDDREQKRGN